MPRAFVLLDTTPPPITLSSSSSSSSSSSIIIATIILSSALILSATLYCFLLLLSRRSSTNSTQTQNHCHRQVATTTKADSDQSLPIFTFGALKRDISSKTSSSDCAICLSNFEPSDQLRLLPLCCHAFHAHCIDTWLSTSHDTCPLCRSTVHPTDAHVLNKVLSRTGSYRIEIGSLSRRETPATYSRRERQRIYSMGPLEYVVEGGYEVSIGPTNEGGDSDKEAVVGVPRESLDDDVAGRSWLMSYVDRLGTFSRRGSGRFFGGSVRRSNVSGNSEDTEMNRIGEEISELFRWISGE